MAYSLLWAEPPSRQMDLNAMIRGTPSLTTRGSGALVLVALVLIELVATARPAFAYIDPGSGSMVVQLLLGGFAGLAVLIKLTWHRIIERLRLKPRLRPPL